VWRTASRAAARFRSSEGSGGPPSKYHAGMHVWHPIVSPNEQLASDTIRTSTIRSRETFAEVTVQVPLTADLGRPRALGVWG